MFILVSRIDFLEILQIYVLMYYILYINTLCMHIFMHISLYILFIKYMKILLHELRIFIKFY